MSLLRSNTLFSKLKSKLLKDSEHLLAHVTFFKQSLQLDITKYGEQHKEGVCKYERQCKVNNYIARPYRIVIVVTNIATWRTIKA